MKFLAPIALPRKKFLNNEKVRKDFVKFEILNIHPFICFTTLLINIENVNLLGQALACKKENI